MKIFLFIQMTIAVRHFVLGSADESNPEKQTENCNRIWC